MTRRFMEQVRNRTNPARTRRGSVLVEYLLLLTIVGIGAIVGLAVVRQALFTELQQLAAAINAIIP